MAMQVDPWCENIWGPLKAALAEAAGGAKPAAAAAPAPAAPAAAAAAPAAAAPEQQQAEAAPAPAALVNGLAPEGVDLKGAPALALPRIEVDTEVSAEVRVLGLHGLLRRDGACCQGQMPSKQVHMADGSVVRCTAGGSGRCRFLEAGRGH